MAAVLIGLLQLSLAYTPCATFKRVGARVQLRVMAAFR